MRVLHARLPDVARAAAAATSARRSDEEIREALSGNLCRCTGYQNIVAAVRLAGERIAQAGDDEAQQ